jgi:hypothetical protein
MMTNLMTAHGPPTASSREREGERAIAEKLRKLIEEAKAIRSAGACG